MTANSKMKRYNPRVFTEQVITMLATVLKSPIEVRIAIIDALLTNIFN